MTIRKSSAWLALLMSFLIALPPAAFADDTELFTTSANPNVLLMLDTTGSMDTAAGGASVGDLDGSSPANSRMDILWKVVYTLLNADLSVPQGIATWTCQLDARIRTSSNPYSRIRVNGANWNNFPATNGMIHIGSGSQAETVTYTTKSISGGDYYFNLSPSVTFAYGHSTGTTVSYTQTSGVYSLPYPLTNAQAENTDFLNNLTTEDENTLKARLGLQTFSSGSPGSGTSGYGKIWTQIQPTDNNSPPFNRSYRSIWSTTTVNANANGGTPNARALRQAQTFFDIATANNTVDICRPNFAVMITDGEDTLGGSPSGGSGNGGGPDYYSGSGTTGTFYPDGNPGTFNNRGQVARHNAVIQEAWNLKTHSPSVQLFTVGVGISDNVPHLRVLREVLRRAAEQNDARADVGASNPNTGVYYNIGTTVDNTARGAGKAFFATDAAELATSMRNIFQQITAGTYSFTAPTVASVRMTDRNFLYKASFKPATPPATYWEGHLEALTINPDNTLTSNWDAGNVLKATLPGNRRIYTGSTDNVTWSTILFTTSTITPALLDVSSTGIRDNVVNYVRGENHDNNAKLGDIFHSKPVVVGPPSRFFFDQGYSTAEGGTSFADAKATRKRVVYVGTNDGMLHAFLSGTHNPSTGLYDDGTGEELFGYVPYNLLGNLENFLPGTLTSHGYYVDSSPRVADVWIDPVPLRTTAKTKLSSEWRTVLIAGFRKGGNGYLALDVTDPDDTSNYPKVLWEYTNPTYVAQTWSEPFIGKVRMREDSSSAVKDRWVAIFGGGKSTAGTIGASLVVLDISTGTALKTFTTGIDNVIPASPSVVFDANGYIKFAYAVDLDGSLYKFDFRTTGLRSNGFSGWGVAKIFQAAAGQPAYHRVEPSSIDESTRYLFFGTGDQEFPVSNPGAGKFYAIKDIDTDNTLKTESNLTNLTTSIRNLNGGTVVSGQSGWFVSFASVAYTSNDPPNSHSREKVLSDPVVFFNNVFFTTFNPDTSNPCSGGGIARVYGLQILNAGAGLASIASMGETSTAKVPYHVYSGSEGGIPSSPSLSIYPSGQSSIFVGFSTGVIKEIKIESPPQMKTIKSWKEIF